MTSPIYYLIEQNKNRSTSKYVYYLTPYEASIHGSISAVTPALHSDVEPVGVEGQDHLITYSNYD